MYFIALLKPLTTEIKEDPLEVQAGGCKWMSVDEYRKLPQISPLMKEVAAITWEYVNGRVESVLRPRQLPPNPFGAVRIPATLFVPQKP